MVEMNITEKTKTKSKCCYHSMKYDAIVYIYIFSNKTKQNKYMKLTKTKNS